MKLRQAETVLQRFFEEWKGGEPAQKDLEPVLDRVWEQLEWEANELVEIQIPAKRARPFRLAWAGGMVIAVVLISALLWRQGPPFPVAETGNAGLSPFLRQSAGQARETLQLTAPQDVFELASINLLSPSSDAAKTANQAEAMNLALTGCSAGSIGRAQLNPGRLTISAASVLSLVMFAYGKECELVEGGPGWARSGEFYSIQALLPEGTPSYTPQEVQNGNAPRLRRMLQNLLADRFQLVLSHEFREMPVYALTVASREKLKLSPEETRTRPPGFPSIPGIPPPQVGRGQSLTLQQPSGEVKIFAHAISMSVLAGHLRRYAGRIVVDKSGLNEVFDIDLSFTQDPSFSNLPTAVAPIQQVPPFPGVPQPPSAPVPGPSLNTALEEQLGLRLESTRASIEVLVIESVERPSEN